MSRENVEVVRQATAEFDRSQVLSDAFAPDFVLEMATLRDYVGPSEFCGASGFFEFFGDWVEAYDEWEQRIENIRDGGGSHVVVELRQRGRLVGSPAWVELHYGVVFTVEGHLIRRLQVYGSPGEALEAAGLRE